MRDLNHQLKKLCRHCREGSYATQVMRERMLTQVANQLHALGYRGMTTRSLKPKHVDALVKLWFDQGLSIGTLKNRLVLKASWTKGGRERTIPIRTEVQRDVLNRARRLAGLGSLIPSHRNYVQQLRVYEGNTLRAGLSQMHGLRHAYAQHRYAELTGWQAPAAGGPTARSLTPEQRQMDRQARLTISQELGHEREQITAAYLGR